MTPEQSQRLSALKKGNRVRSEKAATKEKLRRGELKPSDVIRTTTLPLTVREIILSTPAMGVVKMRRIVRDLKIDPFRPVAVRNKHLPPITPAQRAALADRMDGRYVQYGTCIACSAQIDYYTKTKMCQPCCNSMPNEMRKELAAA